MLRFGIDLGGTKTEILALDHDGRERLRRRVATPSADYAGTVEAIAALVRAAENELGESGSVGIATPGAVSRLTGRIKNANSTCLNGQPLVEDLQRALAREIRIENDANCFALSEATDGAAVGAAVVFGVILGTGVGGGVVVNGRTLIGANAIGGEWGHNPLPAPRDDERPGHRCYCGRMGCIETWLSGPGVAQHFRERDGRALDAAMIVRAAAEGDASAEAAMRDYEDRLARSLATVINLLDPDVIVLGGGLSKIARLYDNVPKLWNPYVFSDQVVTRLVPPQHGDSSGVRGAAWLWNDA
ncbi:MAG: ROK family protein [Betaproteobacteria bacterium]|nr:ROK family protein [Betaproteobacteria bacterium]